jgi:hypothetical protein
MSLVRTQITLKNAIDVGNALNGAIKAAHAKIAELILPLLNLSHNSKRQIPVM